MPANHYQFVTEWVIPAPREAAWPLLADSTTYPKWWPAVYLSAEVETGPQGVAAGRRTRFHAKGALPYHLYWTAASLAQSSGAAAVRVEPSLGDGPR